MGRINAGTLGPLGALVEGLAQLGQEDNGRWSTTRSAVYLILGLVAGDVLVQGAELCWMHVALVGIAMGGKVLQKAFEKPSTSMDRKFQAP